jgi:hypothetical protein
MFRSSHYRSGVITALISVTVAAAGCGEKPAADVPAAAAAPVASACAGVSPSAEYVAFIEYIKATSPSPQRFLTAAGTDSAAPEDGFRAMQDKGPSYFFAGDDAAKEKLKQKLAAVGPYASLLIVFRGATPSTNGDTINVALGGHFFGGEHDGVKATSRNMIIACTDSAWKAVSSNEDTTR